MIIERTLGLVLGPSTALHRYFLEHCRQTNKAMGTTSIWQDLSKPPLRRQGPGSRPLWLLFGIPSALGPELASRMAEYSLFWRMSFIYFDILFSTWDVCVSNYFYSLSALIGCWSSVFIRRITSIYKILYMCHFDYSTFAVSGKVDIP